MDIPTYNLEDAVQEMFSNPRSVADDVERGLFDRSPISTAILESAPSSIGRDKFLAKSFFDLSSRIAEHIKTAPVGEELVYILPILYACENRASRYSLNSPDKDKSTSPYHVGMNLIERIVEEQDELEVTDFAPLLVKTYKLICLYRERSGESESDMKKQLEPHIVSASLCLYDRVMGYKQKAEQAEGEEKEDLLKLGEALSRANDYLINEVPVISAEKRKTLSSKVFIRTVTSDKVQVEGEQLCMYFHDGKEYIRVQAPIKQIYRELSKK